MAKARRAPSDEATSPPTRAALHEAALAAVGRRALTRAALTTTLERRASVWAKRAARSGASEDDIERELDRLREDARAVVARFVEVGLVNDAAFASARAQRLARDGRSSRAIAAHLAAKGVAADTAREAVSDDPRVELAAALTHARKKRIGPFAREETTREARQKHLAAMARAGFSFSVAERALRMDPEDAETLLAARRGL
jgi:regulatory protein